MRWIGLGLAAVIVLISAVTLIAPAQRMAFEITLMDRAGFGVIAVMRVVIAMILILAAPKSRAPRAVRAFGIVVLVAGLATPWFATGRGQAVVNELVKSGPAVMRTNGLVGLALGGFLVYTLRP